MGKNCYLYKGERLVFEGEGWGIIIDVGSATRRMGHGRTYATHKACTRDFKRSMLKEGGGEQDLNLNEREYVYGEVCWNKKMANTICKLCSDDVPAGIQALVMLSTWNRR